MSNRQLLRLNATQKSTFLTSKSEQVVRRSGVNEQECFMTLFSSKGSAVSVVKPIFSSLSINVKSKTLIQLSSAVLLGTLVSACGSSDSSSSTPDTTAPEITLSGADSVELGQGRDYLEYGLTVIDDVDGDISEFSTTFTAGVDNECADITFNESDDYNCVDDIFYVTYTASDIAGNVSEALERTVTIVEARPFIFTYQITEAGETFTPNIDPDNYSYDFTIDWGDDSIDEGVTGEITHTYAAAGNYTVQISGDFPKFKATSSSYVSIEQWGDIKWQNVEGFLTYATNVVGNATDTPDLRLVDSLAEFFAYAEAFNGDISLWQVGHITDMEETFFNAHAFNQDIGDWDVSSVTTLKYTFATALAFNQDISNWDVSSVTTMENTFSGVTMFNQDISGWDVSQVENFYTTFVGTDAFDQDLSGWDFSSATDMSFMFWFGNLSTENYDKLLNSLAAQDVPAGQSFSGGYSVPSDASLDAVDTLTNDKGWTFYYNY
ncbi:BspA family leucine-rich repeat surface protein [Psychromonas sp.]|nr:BspA family leucine-rich repeat surface protein [Psychromonas sp.]